MQVISWIVFGAFIGWLASWIMGRRSGCITSIALGLVGALAGGARLSARGARVDFNQQKFIVSTLVAVIGAVIVIAIYNAITGHR
jgi:uncharacterized membrane protein YeaQ/YmgE (transglycosylase-associated protein family)